MEKSKTTKPKSDLRLNPNGIEKPAELDNQIWLDFLKTKKQRTKDDLNITAWNRFINPVLLAQQKTNHSLDEIFGFWIAETKWVGFNCDWYLNRLETNNQPIKPMQQSNFGNQNKNPHHSDIPMGYENYGEYIKAMQTGKM